MKIISIIGAGAHTRSSINLLKQNFSGYDFLIFDDTFDCNNNELIHDTKLIAKVKEIDRDSLTFLSIGDNKKRASYFHRFQSQLIKKNLFHKNSITENIIKIGISNQIFANVYINSYVEIGDNNIINSSSILEHEVSIGSHNHISVNAKLCGRVKIGDNCMIGAGAVIIDKISICNNVTVAAGAVVTKDIFEGGIYVGIPARKLE